VNNCLYKELYATVVLGQDHKTAATSCFCAYPSCQFVMMNFKANHQTKVSISIAKMTKLSASMTNCTAKPTNSTTRALNSTANEMKSTAKVNNSIRSKNLSNGKKTLSKTRAKHT